MSDIPRTDEANYVEWFQKYATGNEVAVAKELTRLQTALAAANKRIGELTRSNTASDDDCLRAETALAARDAEIERLQELAFALYRGPQEGSAEYEGARLDVGRLMRAALAQPKEPT